MSTSRTRGHFLVWSIARPARADSRRKSPLPALSTGPWATATSSSGSRSSDSPVRTGGAFGGGDGRSHRIATSASDVWRSCFRAAVTNKQSLSYYQQAIDVARQAHSTSIGLRMALHTCGHFDCRIGDLAHAEGYNRQAIELEAQVPAVR